MSQLLKVADVAADQSGLFTTRQARRMGLSYTGLNRLLTRGVIEQVEHGVYRLAGNAGSEHDALRASWLATEPEALAPERLVHPAAGIVVSHRSAARLHDLGDVEADVVEFTSPRRRQSRRPWVRFHRAALSAADVTVVDGLPVTTVERTIADLAAAHLDGGHLGGVVADAIWKQHLSVGAARKVLRPFAHTYGHVLGDDETFVARLLTDAGLPLAPQEAVDLTRPTYLSPKTRRALQEMVAQTWSPAIRDQMARFIRDLGSVPQIADTLARASSTARELGVSAATAAATRADARDDQDPER